MTAVVHTKTLTIRALDESVLAAVRSPTHQPAERALVGMRADGGEPLRCCLRNALAGDEIILFGHSPALPASPYREVGPVFAHAKACGGPAFHDTYPPDWVGRRQILRAYDRRGWIHHASREHDGFDALAAIEAVLADPEVVEVHSRNVVYGCFMFVATRRGETGFATRDVAAP
jgi:hypothetical protein